MSRNVRVSFMDGLALAIRDGVKTETRRLLAPQPDPAWTGAGCLWYPNGPDDKRSLAYDGERHFRRGAPLDFARVRPGDEMQVCEALVAGDAIGEWGRRPVLYRADGEAVVDADGDRLPWPWKVRTLPARYCPAWAVRTRRVLTSVRIERLSDITDAGAVAEGIARLGWESTAAAFQRGFRQMHGLSEEADPWVWVYRWDAEVSRG